MERLPRQTGEFETSGGTEAAPMSTTPDPAIAIAYGQVRVGAVLRTVGASASGFDAA